MFTGYQRIFCISPTATTKKVKRQIYVHRLSCSMCLMITHLSSLGTVFQLSIYIIEISFWHTLHEMNVDSKTVTIYLIKYLITHSLVKVNLAKSNPSYCTSMQLARIWLQLTRTVETLTESVGCKKSWRQGNWFLLLHSS